MSNSFYGDESQQAVSFLEFGSINLKNQSKSTWAFVMHQEAYDLYMFSRYARDLFHFRDFQLAESPTAPLFYETVQKVSHRKILLIALKYAGYLAVRDAGKPVGICEIGSSLFGLIDEVAALDRLISNGTNIQHIQSGNYTGCEISDLMNRGTREFHPKASFDLHSDGTASEFLKRPLQYDLFYAHGISLQYSLRSARDLVDICARGALSVLFLACFSLNGTKAVDIGTGKKGYQVDIGEWIKQLRSEGLSAKFYTKGVQYDSGVVGTRNHLKDALRLILTVGKPGYTEAYVTHFKEIHNTLSTGIEGYSEDTDGEWLDISELSAFCAAKGYPSSF